METTVNIRIDILNRINIAAESWGISQSAVIMILIRQLMNEIPDQEHPVKMVRYQKRGGADGWHTFHIQVNWDEYDFLQDVRKFFRMSVSLAVAYSVNKYLRNLMRNRNTDNYRFQNYIVIREIVDNIISWRIFWGYPRTIGKLIPCATCQSELNST